MKERLHPFRHINELPCEELDPVVHDPQRRPANTERPDDLIPRVPHRRSDAANAVLVFHIVDGISPLADTAQLLREHIGVGDGLLGAGDQPLGDDLLQKIVPKKGEHGFPDAGAVHLHPDADDGARSA